MGLTKKIDICSLNQIESNNIILYGTQSCHEVSRVEIPPETIDSLFVHHSQTDQLMVLKGSSVIVILQNRQYQYIPLQECIPIVLKIPPGIPHTAINLSPEPCFIVNAIIRHNSPHKLDYRQLTPPFDYDLSKIRSILKLSQDNHNSNKY